MKKNLLLAVIYLVLGFPLAIAQDNILEIPTNDKASLFDDKANNYGQFCGYDLSTSTYTDNGNYGIIFKVKALDNIVINGFSLPFEGSTSPVRIYKKIGDYTGYVNSPAFWQLVDTGLVTPNGNIIFCNSFPQTYIPAGSEVSFYIMCRNTIELEYKNGTAEGAVLTQNNDLILYEGVGVDGQFGAAYSPRTFVGKIHYCKPTQYTCDTTATLLSSNNSNFGVFFNVATKSKMITLENIFTHFNGKLANIKLYYKNGTYEGFEGNPAAWTPFDSSVICNPINNVPEAVSDGFSLNLPPNSITGFYLFIKNNAMTISYNNGTTFNDTIRNDDFVAIVGGKGSNNEFVPNELARHFKGTLAYCVDNTAIDEAQVNTLGIYPNPTVDFINIPASNLSVERIQVMDITGKTVINRSAQNQSEIITLDVSVLNRGSYFIKVISKGNAFVETFIKQ